MRENRKTLNVLANKCQRVLRANKRKNTKRKGGRANRNKWGWCIRRISLMQTAGHESDRQVFPHRPIGVIEIYTLSASSSSGGKKISDELDASSFDRRSARRSKRIELCTSVVAKLSPIQHFSRLLTSPPPSALTPTLSKKKRKKAS